MTTLRLRHVFAAALAFCFLALGATDAQATHFRYGTLRWEELPITPPDATQVRIKVTAESAWRESFAWPNNQNPTIGVPLDTGQDVVVQRTANGSNVFVPVPLMVTPSSINLLEDWFVGSTQLEFQFARNLLPVRIFFTGAARVSNLADENRDDNFRVETVMDTTPNAAAPVASILPIITVGYPLPAAKFFIPAADVEGDTLTWSIAPQSRSLLTTTVPNGVLNNFPTLSINPTTGEVTWNTSQEHSPDAPQGPPPLVFSQFYAVQFIVTDSKGGETPVDALLRVKQIVPNPPVAHINDSPNQYVVAVRPGTQVRFTVKGIDNDPGATVTLTSGNVPLGSTMVPSLPTVGSSPVSSVFTWTPVLADAGNSYAVQFAVTDEFGNQATNSAVITVLENFAPSVTCPDERIAEATGPNGADNVTLEATVSDQDPDPLTIKWFVDGVLVETDTATGPGTTVVSRTQSYAFLPFPHAIRVEVTDGQATRECTSTVKVVDTTPPDIPPMLDIVVEATSPAGAPATWTTPDATDIVDGILPVTCDRVSGSMFPYTNPPSAITVTCTATDTRGNTATETFTVTVVDTTPPHIPPMLDIVVEATGPNGAPATWTTPDATDIVDGILPVTCDRVSGSTFPLTIPPSAITVTCTATDARGNMATETFTVTVLDRTPPVISNNPGNRVEEATGPAGAAVTWPPLIATDIADPNVPVVCSPASGSTFAITPPAPIATVTCTATDDSGNEADPATFTVRVQDTTPPVITGFGNITVQGSGGGAFVPWPPPTAVDLVDGVRPVTCVPASGSFFPIGTTTVTCTASDTRGNTRTVTFTVTVVNGDTKPPKVCLTLKPGSLWPPNHKMRTIQVILKVTDNQDPTPTCAITSVTSSEPVTGPKYGNTTPDWTFNGLHLQLRAERYSKHGRTYTVTVRCMDDAGNTTNTVGTVRVPHDQGHHGLLGGEEGLLGGNQDTNGGGHQSGKCCLKPRPHGDHDDDDDDGHFWTNDPDNTTGGGENKDPKPCPNPDIDDDDDHGDDDDDDGRVTDTPDATGTK